MLKIMVSPVRIRIPPLPAGRKFQEQYRGIPKKQDLYILQNGGEAIMHLLYFWTTCDN